MWLGGGGVSSVRPAPGAAHFQISPVALRAKQDEANKLLIIGEEMDLLP